MKMETAYKEEQILEFDKIKDIWKEYAFTQKAKTTIEQTHPILSEIELQAKQRETTEARMMLEKCGNPPLVSLEGIEELLAVADKGDCLNALQLEQIEVALVAVKRLRDYLNKGKMLENSLAYYENDLDALDDVREYIRMQIYHDTVVDDASRLLRSLRNDIARAEDKMREKADSVIRSNKDCMSDSFSTFRNGHICIPVKKDYKFKIAGTVIDKSSTGATLFIEPAASAKYYEELQTLRMDEDNEVRRILYELTVMVDENKDVIKQNISVMERLDFIFSKGKLSQSYEGTAPTIVTDRSIILTDARHPLMDRNMAVPLQFKIGDSTRGIVITGPNTGGKTVAIKTVALNCMMAQCGLHMSCREATICMNTNYLCDIGDGQNLSENLSTFSAHIVNVLSILKRVNKDSLVIMDELGSGTDPMEGMGIAIAILEELKKSECLFLVTTHYPEVKTYAEKEAGIVNARMTFDKENLKPLYQMVIGEAGESCAFYIASRLGMPAEMLACAAEAAYGDGYQTKKSKEDGNRQERNPKNIWNCESSTEHGNQNRNVVKKESHPHLIRKKEAKVIKEIPFQRGDSVMIFPDKKIGIVCETANEKGNLQIQLPNKKIWINYKRVKLQVSASELYPADYDFSIIFDTVENRKLRHDMERKYTDQAIIRNQEEM